MTSAAADVISVPSVLLWGVLHCCDVCYTAVMYASLPWCMLHCCDVCYTAVMSATLPWCALHCRDACHAAVMYATLLWCIPRCCGACHAAVMYATLLWCIPRCCDACHAAVMYATLLWCIPRCCGACHAAVMYATLLWCIPRCCGACHAAVTYATLLWCIPRCCGACHAAVMHATFQASTDDGTSLDDAPRPGWVLSMWYKFDWLLVWPYVVQIWLIVGMAYGVPCNRSVDDASYHVLTYCQRLEVRLYPSRSSHHSDSLLYLRSWSVVVQSRTSLLSTASHYRQRVWNPRLHITSHQTST